MLLLAAALLVSVIIRTTSVTHANMSIFLAMKFTLIQFLATIFNDFYSFKATPGFTFK